MQNELPATELLPRPTRGRVFEMSAKVRLGDVDRNARLRLDAAARFLQDAATDDAAQVGLDRRFGWVVRRTKIDTAVPGVLGEEIRVSTWCTAIGRAWAERRSQILGSRGAVIDAVSLWVQIDTATGVPARVGEDFIGPYGEASNGRSVGARLMLPAPTESSTALAWTVRRTDLDPFGHVNNAATWTIVEEVAEMDGGDRIGVAELEYPHPIEADVPVSIATASVGGSTSVWATDADGDVLAAARWTPVNAT